MSELYHPVQLPLFSLSKVCSHCQQEKPIEAFSKDIGQKSGYRPYCKECVKQHRSVFTPSPLLTTKVCSQCGAEKPIEEFNKNRYNTTGRQAACKKCAYERRKELIEVPLSQVCIKCKVKKPINQFYRTTNNKSGYRADCKACNQSVVAAKAGRTWKPMRNNTRYRTRVRTTKWCYTCKTEKPFSEFRKDSTKKDGLHSYCKECQDQWGKTYHETHREERLAKNKEWRQQLDWPEYYAKHKLKLLAKHAVYRAKKKTTRIGKVSYTRILERDGLRCYICEKDILPEDLTFDHIVPLNPRPGEPQGTHTEDNIKPAHRCCNSRKSNRRFEDLTPYDRRGP